MAPECYKLLKLLRMPLCQFNFIGEGKKTYMYKKKMYTDVYTILKL